MTIADLKTRVIDNSNDFYFGFRGKRCGVEQTVVHSVATYDMWCGEQEKQYTDFDEMIKDKFFDGKSIAELIEEVEFDFY